MNKKLRELIARFPHVNPMARQCTDSELEAYMVQGIAAQNAEVEQLKAQRDELAKLLNELLRQIDVNDFMDSCGHTAKMLKAVHDGMEALSRIEVKP